MKRTWKRFFETVLGIRARRMRIIRILRLRQEYELMQWRIEEELNVEDDPRERINLHSDYLKTQLRIRGLNQLLDKPFF